MLTNTLVNRSRMDTSAEVLWQAKQLKSHMAAIEEHEKKTHYTSKVGAVQISITGNYHVCSVHIDPQTTCDTHKLSHDIQNATNRALQQLQKAQQDALLAAASAIHNTNSST